jgi:gas vesicle protein
MENDSRFVLVAGLAFLTGIMLGTGLGLLMAPQSGSRTRRQLRNMVEDAGERVGELAEDAKGTVTNMVEQGKKLVKEGG